MGWPLSGVELRMEANDDMDIKLQDVAWEQKFGIANKMCFDVLYYGYEIDVSNVLYIYKLRYSILTPICLYIHCILMYMYMWIYTWYMYLMCLFFLKAASFCRLPIYEAIYRCPPCRTILRAPPCGSPSPQADGTCIAGAECTGSSFEAWVFQHSRGIHDFSQP